MILTSSAFADGATIPSRHTCDGENLSPPLSWRDVPDGTVALALVVDDPDAPAGTWVHWVLFNVPASETGLSEGLSGAHILSRGTIEGTNSWGRCGYGGPCPPSGTHRYFFKLYALDGPVGLSPSATADDLVAAIERRVLAESVLMGRYARSTPKRANR